MAKQCIAETIDGKCKFNVYSHNYCQWHQSCRTDSKWLNQINKKKEIKPIAKYSPKTSLRSSQLHVLYESILSTRKHISFVSGLKIEGNYSNCVHVLAKGQNQYPLFALCDFNIVLLTMEEHHLFDHGTIDSRRKYAAIMIKKGVPIRWDLLYAKVYELKTKYKELYG